jgi:glycosyltransferase involved in cell wall biosynthesis
MDEKKKTVVLLVPGFPANEADTTCIPFLQQFCLAFIRVRPDVELKIISFQYPALRGHYMWHGIPIYCAGGKSYIYNRPLVWLRVFMQLLKIRKENELVIINSFWMTECSLVGQWFARLFKIKQIAYVAGQDALKTNQYFSFINLKKMEVIAMSESLKNTFYKSTGFKIQHIIPSGIDITKVKSTNEERTIDILGVGALTPLKNYTLFIELINDLKKEKPEIKACIIGKGEQACLLKEKIQAYNLENTIELLGELPHDTVFSYMQKSKILLHTSGYEGQSTVIMEALACGLTVVCFDVGRIHAEDKILVCQNKDDMLNTLKNSLSSSLSHQPLILQTNDDMAKSFFKIYAI